ncbi:MAG: hypothetical protein WCI67_02110 [Chloroflexales bacterium]
MHPSRMSVTLALAGALLIAACSNKPADLPYKTTAIPVTPTVAQAPAASGGYPAPAANANDTGYPAPPAQAAGATDEGRSQTVFQSYQAALTWATQNFGPDAQLYEVVPSRVMLANLGNPPTALGWFYKFRAASKQGDDLFVQVVNGQFSGSRVLSPLGEVPKPELPIEISKLTIDSSKALEIFAQRGPAMGVTVDPHATYDLHLINLQGTPGPIWSVLSPKDSTPILWIDASTGGEASDPNK